tara:strand:- start:47 stop:673 length:627 start_codon:yes stop_codon:yes gene_type:complete
MYRFLYLLFLFLFSCTSQKVIYEKKGFLVLNNEGIIAIKNIKKNKLVKIINIENMNYVKVTTNEDYKGLENRVGNVDLVTFNNLKLSKKFPLVIVEESIENPKFIAKKAKIFDKEKKVASSVFREEINMEISSEIDKNIYLEYGPFHNKSYANVLVRNLEKNISKKKIVIKFKKNDNYVSVGPLVNLKEFDNYSNKLNKLDGYNIIIK